MTKDGKLKNIHDLKIWRITDILIEKYRFKVAEAMVLGDFLTKMLQWEPKDRASAK